MRRCLVLLVVLAFLVVSPVAHGQATTPYLGQILMVGFNFAPNNWALCNGQILSISQNTALFSLIGTYYGGDGQTTFALPDLRGRVPVGQGQGPGLSPYVIGETGGEEQVTLTISNMPAHSHPLMGTSMAGTSASPTGTIWGAQSRLDIYSSATPDTPMGGGSVGTAGGGLPHDNRSPYLTITYIIALEGVYPPRS
ncbi:MAG: tail fiber protein [Candidatus Acidiferrales bacterium]